jgi:P-type Cu2+ transporter
MPLDLATGCPSGLGVAERSGAVDLSDFVATKAGLNSIELLIRGAKCGGCVSRIEGALRALDGVTSVHLNLTTSRLKVEWQVGLGVNQIAEGVRALGYGVSPFEPDAADAHHVKEERELLTALGVAGFCSANIMLLSVSVWAGKADMGEATRQMMHAISGVIALPAVVYSGQPFFRSAFAALRKGHANMDVPISLAILLAFSSSVYETFHNGEHAYFDACAMLLFFLLIGRFLNARLARRAHAAAHDLAALRGRTVTRITASGTTEAVRAERIESGDMILLAAGERAVVDFLVSEGASDIDESLVTGESLPVPAGAGRLVHSGSVNLGAPLKGRVLRDASRSLMSEIADMLAAGEQKRSTYRRISDKAVQIYVPFVHTTAFLAFLGWSLSGAGLRDAIMIAVTTLIITCPCALALAAPVVQVVAAGRLFRSGVFLKSGDALERLATIDHVVFDKTGTLTLGQSNLQAENICHETLERAAQLARASRHPLSRAIARAAGAGPVLDGITEHAGLGLEGAAEGRIWRLGSAEWLGVPAAMNAGVDGPHVWFGAVGDKAELFTFEDRLRDGAREVIERLGRDGIGVEIVSGDREDSVARVAQALGISMWHSCVLPSDKAARLETLRQEGRRVLMVGDGLNDAGALALAHASIAPGGAMDVSQSACDAVFAGESLQALIAILDNARSARRGMLENFALAALYNIIAVPIAVLGLVTPLIAAIAMSASSVVVTLNALRMKSTKRQWKS